MSICHAGGDAMNTDLDAVADKTSTERSVGLQSIVGALPAHAGGMVGGGLGVGGRVGTGVGFTAKRQKTEQHM